MSEAVLKVVALDFQDIERLVLDLPSGPAAGGQFDDRVGTDRGMTLSCPGATSVAASML